MTSLRTTSKIVKITALAALSCAGLAAAPASWSVGSTPVTVVNGTSQPIPVKGELVSAATEAYQVTMFGSINPGEKQPNVWFSVPVGKRLVVEHVSVLTVVPSGQVVIVRVGPPGGNIFQHRLVLSPIGAFGGGLDWFVASQPIRMYVNGAVQALFVEVMRNSGTGYGSIEASVSGYLVDAP
jgi:hypothetical protein